jgi:transcriptional regulator with XRE-family HTH domain
MRCETCHGDGYIQGTDELSWGVYRPDEVTCPDCGGNGISEKEIDEGFKGCDDYAHLILAVRSAEGLSVEALAKMLNLKASRLDEIERGLGKVPVILLHWLAEKTGESQRELCQTMTGSCIIPLWESRQLHGTMFCAICDICIPEDCKGDCDPAKGTFWACSESCACKRPTPESRMSAFVKWVGRVREFNLATLIGGETIIGEEL